MEMRDFLQEKLFPYDTVRAGQFELVGSVAAALLEKRDLIVHAPTGIGKTASVLAPALAHALKENLTVFFLTSRHMQHQIVLKTLHEIKSRYKVSFQVTDIIGKKWMCLQAGVDALPAGEFHQYCKNLRDEKKCEFYLNTRNQNMTPTVAARSALHDIKLKSPCSVHDIVEIGSAEKLCPYELAVLTAPQASVIISDYYYIFNEGIRSSFFSKINKELPKSILIIDEGHNLPQRIRELLSSRLSMAILERAIKEVHKAGRQRAQEYLQRLKDFLVSCTGRLHERGKSEDKISAPELITFLESVAPYDSIVLELSEAALAVMEEAKRSAVISVVRFLEGWPQEGEGFSRIISAVDYRNPQLLLKCLDPSIFSRKIIEDAYATFLMSGTLTPTAMYKDILGFLPDTIEKEFSSPFPKSNTLNLIIPKTTTKYSQRTDAQYTDIATICADICARIPGNCIVFFPSYFLMERVGDFFKKQYHKTIFMEKSAFSKSEKEEFIAHFKRYRESGATLLAVSSGSFGEGLDMPGVLKGVIVVGLPLQKPDLQTQEIISYYDAKTGKGWDYGYVLPALTKSIQNAGRCIRTEADRGVRVFLDQRYAQTNYMKSFPKDWNIYITTAYAEKISEFFPGTQKQ